MMRITDERRNATSQVEKDLNRMLADIKSSPSDHNKTTTKQNRVYISTFARFTNLIYLCDPLPVA